MTSSFQTSAAVCATDQATVLSAIVAKLRADISDLLGTATTCFVSDVPWPGVEVQDDVFCTVCPNSSRFDADRPTGAAELGIVEIGQFQVTVWSKLSLDQIERSGYAFLDAARGLLILKKRILKSLAGQQIYSDAPTNAVPLLVEYLRPVAATHPPTRQRDSDFSSFSLAFEGPFYWDLS